MDSRNHCDCCNNRAFRDPTLKRQHPGDGAFLAIAFYLSVSLAWLISGVRYVTGLYAIYPMLALLPKERTPARRCC